MSFFTRVRDFAEGALGGSAIFGVVGGFAPLPGRMGEIEKAVGGDILMLAGGQFIKATAGELAKNAVSIAAASARQDASLKAEAQHNRQIALQRQMGETPAQWAARLRALGYRVAAPAPTRTLPASRVSSLPIRRPLNVR